MLPLCEHVPQGAGKIAFDVGVPHRKCTQCRQIALQATLFRPSPYHASFTVPPASPPAAPTIIEFQFDLEHDTAESISNEMMTELQLT